MYPAMAMIETWFEQDLQKAVKVNHIDGKDGVTDGE